MNDDRISEVYKGEIWSDDAQERARRRIHWMIRQVEGQRVLDVGCSQGIVAILLGREGFEVVGVDVQTSRIEYATEDLAKEEEATRQRVTFMVGDAGELPFPDDHFDSVIMGEVIEHLAAPDRVLQEAARVLRPGGVLVLTTPFGVLHHHDHKQTFFPDDLYELVSKYFGVRSGEVADRYFRLVAVKGEGEPSALDDLRASAYKAVEGIQQDLARTRIELNRKSAELETSIRNRELAVRRRQEAEARIERIEATWKQTKADLQRTNAALRESEAALKATRAQLAEAEERYRALAAEFKRTADQANTAQKLANEAGTLKARLERRERDIERLRYRLAVADWKLASSRRRKWWRIGAELGAVRRNPAKVLLLPLRLVRILGSKSKPLPRPTPPSTPSKESGEKSSEPGPAVDPPVRPPEPIVPRRDVVALGLIDQELRDRLTHELQVFDLDVEDWHSQLELFTPSLLIVDSGVDALERLEIGDLLAAARDAGVTTVLWDSDPKRVDEAARVVFDVISGEEKPAEGFAGRWVERHGSLLQPRIHNPVRKSRPKHDSGMVVPQERQIDGVAYRTEREFIEAVKEYKVLSVAQETAKGDLSPIAATATPITLVGEAEEVGLVVSSEEERAALERSLLRSEVLGARLAHKRMRRALRSSSITPHVETWLKADLDPLPRIDVMVATRRPERLEAIFDNLARQTYPNIGLWLVAHGIEVDKGRADELAAEANVFLGDVLHLDESVILGEVFNIGFGETESAIVAKMDDDDFYGDEYLWDLYTALDFSGADVAGKWAHYVYLEGLDTMIYRFERHEHRFTDVVAISTLLMRREVLEAERFPAMPWGSGSVFLRALGSQGGRVFAADRWNYVYLRKRNGDGNTFPVSDLDLLSNSRVVCRGINLGEVVV